MAEAIEKSKFAQVDLGELQVGMLVERPLYAHLPLNGRYMLLVHKLQPLEAGALEKLRKLGGAHSPEARVDERYPELAASASRARQICDDESLAPFEKNRAIREATSWLLKPVLENEVDVAVFFVHRAFGRPEPQTLQFVSDASVAAYEHGLRLGALSTLLALWLSYSDSLLLSQIAERVFCDEIRQSNCVVPGLLGHDHRVELLGTGDELAQIVELARWLLSERSDRAAHARASRVWRKFSRLFRLDVARAHAGAGKAAA